MPLKLRPPRKGKTPYFSIRGTYLGIYVDRSCKTDRRSIARTQLKRLEQAIECGEYPPKKAPPSREQPTFLKAAVSYMQAGYSPRFVNKLVKHFGETPLSEIDQAAVDAAALAIHPAASGATRNRCVYTPMAAILHHAKIDIAFSRPKGAKGRIVTDWLVPEDAAAVIDAADEVDAEFGLLLRFLVYTGVRLGEALALSWDGLYLDEAGAWMRRSKGGISGAIKLRDDLCVRLKAHRDADPIRQRVFRFHQGGGLKHYLVRAKLKALGLECPARRPVGWHQPPNRLQWANFHSFRHTWATWMRRYAAADVKDLQATDNWRSERSAARYAHAVARDAWAKVDLLPALERKKG
jgi:integrase